ncbi:hypothetical protein [Actinopolyspora xinjiangensis]|uniref:hypothetical protein n=1 Tax=Actinopolyspora xinjiangensis TaxID=405564 RepID=UPI00111399F9|nr:hypothetical protein [Actinopolyspora xinjiangensis]
MSEERSSRPEVKVQEQELEALVERVHTVRRSMSPFQGDSDPERNRLVNDLIHQVREVMALNEWFAEALVSGWLRPVAGRSEARGGSVVDERRRHCL